MHNLSLCFPPMEGQVNCMHSKLMLLFHPEYVRIVVPTANLTSTDWGENNLMENASALAPCHYRILIWLKVCLPYRPTEVARRYATDFEACLL